MKKVVMIVLSVLVGLMVMGCDDLFKKEEPKFIAEQYRGTFIAPELKQYNERAIQIILTENILNRQYIIIDDNTGNISIYPSSDNMTHPAWTEGNKLFVDYGKNSIEEAFTFINNDSFRIYVFEHMRHFTGVEEPVRFFV
jgi:hypothetical protein